MPISPPTRNINNNKTLILVDGSSYLFRAFHALPDLRNPDNHPTGAMYGVLNMLNRLEKDFPSSHIGVIFDAKGKNFRHELFADYKANRTQMPEDLAVQIQPLHQMIQWLGYPLISEPGVEADDVIGTLTERAKLLGYEVLISTGDKDMAQLIQPNVQIVDTMKNVVMNEDYVHQKFGVHPNQIIDFLALTGDTSDNIPGVPKVGPKTAAKWLGQYQNLDNIIKNAGQISGKVGEYLRENLDQLPLSKKLTTIVTNLELNLDIESLTKNLPDIENLKKSYSQWGFKKWFSQLNSDSDSNINSNLSQNIKPICIQSESVWSEWLAKLKTIKQFAFDTETTHLDPLKADLVGVSFAYQFNQSTQSKSGEIHSAYLPLAHNGPDSPDQLDFEKIIQDLKDLFNTPDIKIIAQNFKYDLKVLAKYNINLNAETQLNCFDTMLASYILEAGKTRHNLDDLALRHLDLKTIHYEDVAGKGAKQIPFNQVTLDQAVPYAAEDARVALELFNVFDLKFQSNPNLYTLFKSIEMPMMFVLKNMEQKGVYIDAELLKQQSHIVGSEIISLEKSAHQIVGHDFNLSSPKQLQTILFEEMDLPIIKKTPKGQPSTNEEVLQILAEDYELPKILLEHRHLSKLKSTYLDKLPLQILPQTQRVHTHYHQAVAATGRLSSSDPNLQNIPIRTPQGRQIRQAFKAPNNTRIIAADYSQIELRIMAHLSQDQTLLKAFKEGLDIHKMTAAEVAGCNIIDVTAEQRRRAKAVNFGLIYGMSAFGLAKQLGISRSEAQDYVNIYFERYPGVLNYMENTRQFAKDHGYVETLFGRRLYLPGIHSKNPMLKKGAERAAINAPMQGTAADIIKRAMIDLGQKLDSKINPDFSKIKMIMQVHDELVFEIDQNLIQNSSIIDIIKNTMENAAQLDVPLTVDIGIGQNWDEAH